MVRIRIERRTANGGQLNGAGSKSNQKTDQFGGLVELELHRQTEKVATRENAQALLVSPFGSVFFEDCRGKFRFQLDPGT